MNDLNENEAWRKHAEDMEMMRKRRRFQFKEVIRELKQMGFEVREISPYQYRIAEWLDIYPSNKRFHDLKTGERGDIRGISISAFIKKRVGIANYNQ